MVRGTSVDANLAKVSGELYFLLERRGSSISVQYSPDKEVTLPQSPLVFAVSRGMRPSRMEVVTGHRAWRGRPGCRRRRSARCAGRRRAR